MSDSNPLNLAGLSLEQLIKLKEDLSLANRGISRDQKMMANRFEMVNAAIRAAENEANGAEDLMVSDHAIVRWLERVGGIDLEPLRKRIKATAAGRYDPHADHDVVISQDDNAVLVIRGGKAGSMVVTVLDSAGPIPEKGQLKVMSE